MFGLEEELKSQLLQIQSFEELKMWKERQSTIIRAVSIARGIGYDADFRTIEGTQHPDWAQPVVAYIELPTGQVAYFMAKSNLAYDQHNREDKLERIRAYMEGRYGIKSDL